MGHLNFALLFTTRRFDVFRVSRLMHAVGLTVWTLALAQAVVAVAGEFAVGAAGTVKAGSLCFLDREALSAWRAVKSSRDSAAVAAYETRLMGAREAWQFLQSQPVTILSHDQARSETEVEMTAPGRFQGTRWFVDSGAVSAD